MKFNIGDSIVVKSAVKDPDTNSDIGGWQGRISEPQDSNIVCIDWDSITLNKMLSSDIKKSEQEGMIWDQMYLDISEIELVSPRDTEEDVKRTYDEIYNKHMWLHLGEEGECIQSVLSGISPDDYWDAFTAWEGYLENELCFPFEAVVDESQERGPLQTGNQVTICGLNDIEERYGILVEIEYRKINYVFALADLEVIQKDIQNYSPVKAYVIWFANR